MSFRDSKLNRIISNIDREVSNRNPDGVIEKMYEGMGIMIEEIKELKKRNNKLTERINKLLKDE